MFWIALAILIIVGWIIYSRRKGKVTVSLTKDQAELALGLVRKEKTEAQNKMQDIVDERALQGKIVEVDSICKENADMTEDVKQGIAKFKQRLLDKYGPTVPVNTAHRISWELEGNGQMWSDSPGCFERHLERRDGNLLFPPGRRIVIRREIEEAREKDRIEQQQFKEKVDNFLKNTRDVIKGKQLPPNEVATILQEVAELIEEAMSIGGNLQNVVEMLCSMEDTLIKALNEKMPEGSGLLQKAKSLSSLNRIPYYAQMKKKDSPMLPEEEVPALLSEDLQTISFAGYISRSFGPNYRPNQADIRSHLESAVNQGFSKERAAEMIAAWNEKKE